MTIGWTENKTKQQAHRGQIYPAVVKDTRNGNLKRKRADGKAIKSKERRLVTHR